MADKKELDRVNQVASLIDRYYQFEDAVDVNKQNIEYHGRKVTNFSPSVCLNCRFLNKRQ